MEERILVVDSNAKEAVLLCQALRRQGYRATACVSTPALGALARENWGLVVTEWDFYHLRGPELIQGLKSWSRPVLVFSAYDTLSLASAAMEEGARGAFSKKRPLDLLEEIGRLLRPAAVDDMFEGASA